MLQTKNTTKGRICIICDKKFEVDAEPLDWKWMVCDKCKKLIECRW